jgi:hypothetical protein
MAKISDVVENFKNKCILLSVGARKIVLEFAVINADATTLFNFPHTLCQPQRNGPALTRQMDKN